MERVAGACAYCTCTRTSPSGQQQCICTRRPHSLICMERNYRCLLCNCSSAQWEGKKDYHPAPYPSQSFKSMRTCCNVWWRIWVILSSSDSLHGREEECIHSPSPPHDGFLGLFPLGSSCRLSRDSRCLQDIVENSAKNHFQTWSLPVCASLPQCMCSSVCLCMLAPVLCTVMHLLMWFDRLKCQYTISVCMCVCTHTSVVMNELSFLFYLDKEQPLLCLDVSIWKQDDHIQNGFAKR